MFNVSFRMRGWKTILAALTCAALVAVGAPGRSPAAAQTADDGGVQTITGKVTVTNQFVLNDEAEPLMALIDLTAFVKRDHDMHLAYPDQTIAGLQGDITQGATFTMPLPIVPRGTFNDVSNGKGTGKGVMIFAIDFDTNAIGDSFMGPYEWAGWPGGLDSLQFDPGTYEVSNGQMVIWAPDDKQMFPTGYGDDGKLFTKDDPVGPLKKGWTVIKLNKDKPFEQVRQPTVDVPILEGLSANNDLSKLSYTAAFDALVKDLRVRYVFTQFKHIDWDALVKQYRPLIEKAETGHDAAAFNLALSQMIASFHDGHLYVQPPQAYQAKVTAGGLGMILGQTDDKQVIVSQALKDLPAAQVGIKPGAQILEWNGQPIDKALSATDLLFNIQSSPIPTRLQQLRYIMRSAVGTKFTIKYKNPDDTDAKTVDLVSVKENTSQRLSSFSLGVGPADMPIQVKLIQQNGKNYGYIKISTFESDSVLLTRTWEWALNRFIALKVPSLIVDVRQNGGGSGLLADYFAGSFYSAPFDLNRTFQADKDGKFLYVGKSVIQPAPVQWTNPVAIMVGPACASACEIFSAAVAHDPSHLVVGRYPTAGVEAGVEAWTLPDGLYFQAPVDRIEYPDGKIFLESVGVTPNVKVPVTAASLLSTDDQELPAAENALDKLVSP